MAASVRLSASFRTVLSTVMVLLVAMVGAALAVLAVDTGHQAIDQTARLLASEVAKAVEGDLDTLVDRPVRVVRRLSSHLADSADPAAPEMLLRDALSTTPDISMAAVFLPNGRQITVRQGERGDLESVSENTGAVASHCLDGKAPVQQFAWCPVRLHPSEEALLLVASQAVHKPDGELLAVVEAGFRLDSLEAMIAGYAREQGAITFILDSQGHLLASNQAGLAVANGVRLRASDSEHPVISAVAGAVRQQDDYQRVLVADEPYDVFGHPVARDLDEHWRLFVAVPRSSFDEPLKRHLRTLVVLTLAALLGAIVLSLFIARGAAKPLKQMAEGAGRIRDGDLTVEFRGSRILEMACLSDSLKAMVGGLRERDRMKDAFARYVSPRLVERVASDPEALKPGGRLTEAVIVFTDLRGFTALTEKLGPERTVELINRYLRTMTDLTDANGGFVTDLMGDGMLIVFGINGETDAARNAVRCMLAMQQALDELDRQSRAEHGIRLEMGAGAHQGEVIVGNIGSATRIKYGVVGDAVNTAARVESLTVGGEVLVSDPLYRACGDALEVGEPRAISVKGKNEPLRVYSVRALKGEGDNAGLTLIGAEPANWVAVQVPANARRLLGKVVDKTEMRVRILSVDDRFLLIESDADLEVHDDLRIDAQGGTIYGRVRRQEPNSRWLIRWTGGEQDPVAFLTKTGPF